MKIRKERAHHCGLSNIDYKTQGDVDSLTKYKDGLRVKNFGTMGRQGLKQTKPPQNAKDSLKMAVGRKPETAPDPKQDMMKEIYQMKEKPIKEHLENMNKKRAFQLEPPTWNERVFVGENPGIQTWYQGKMGNLPEIEESSPTNALIKKRLMKGDKMAKHEGALQETQLVKVTSKDTLEGKVNLN